MADMAGQFSSAEQILFGPRRGPGPQPPVPLPQLIDQWLDEHVPASQAQCQDERQQLSGWSWDQLQGWRLHYRLIHPAMLGGGQHNWRPQWSAGQISRLLTWCRDTGTVNLEAACLTSSLRHQHPSGTWVVQTEVRDGELVRWLWDCLPDLAQVFQLQSVAEQSLPDDQIDGKRS